MPNYSLASLQIRGAISESPYFCGKFSSLRADRIGVAFSFGQFFSVSSVFSISNSRLTNFLSRTITITSSIGDIWVYTSRQILTTSANITHTTFANISGGDYGGAIESNNNYNLQVTFCIFINITSTNEGGAIYKYGGSFILQCSTFTLCHSTLSSDINNGANSVSGFSCDSTVNDTLIYKSWQSTSNAGNSVYRFQTGNIIIRTINDTSSCENNGACCGKFLNPTSESSIQFINGNSNQGYSLNVLWSMPMTVSYSNLINCSLQGNEFWIYQTTLTVSNCYIFGNSASSIYTNGGSIVIVDSVGDNAVSGLHQTSSTVTILISYITQCLPQYGRTDQFTAIVHRLTFGFGFAIFSVLSL